LERIGLLEALGVLSVFDRLLILRSARLLSLSISFLVPSTLTPSALQLAARLTWGYELSGLKVIEANDLKLACAIKVEASAKAQYRVPGDSKSTPWLGMRARLGAFRRVQAQGHGFHARPTWV
jgi:hypothetical protein